MPVSELVRPRTRGECVAGPRPCPWASCRHHLAAELIRAGRIASDDQLPADVPTCSLDMADRGDSTLEEIGAIYGITREAVRIAAKKALARFTHRAIAGDVIDRVGWGVRGKNRADGTTADGPGEPEPDDEHEVEEEPEFLQRDFRPFLADDEELLLVDDRADSRADDAGPWSRSDTRVISVIDANDAGACGLVRRLYDRALEKSDASPNPTLTEVENKCTGG